MSKQVGNCEYQCEENYCKLGNDCGPVIADDCYWSSQSNTCLRAGGILASILLLKYFPISFKTDWLDGANGELEFVKDQTVTLEPMQESFEHGKE